MQCISPLLLAATLTVLAACTTPQPRLITPPTGTPVVPGSFGTWGVDLTSRDLNVRPGDDFNHHANGTWLKRNVIPPDRRAWGPGAQLSDKAEEYVRAIVEGLPTKSAEDMHEQKVRDYYHAYLDVDAIERSDLAPAKPVLTAIAAARTYAEIATLMGRPDVLVKSPISVGITVDQKNPDRYIVTLSQSGLGLPDREHYLNDGQAFVNIRTKYEEHIARMLALALVAESSQQAKAILALETDIARIHWTRAKRRQRDLTYNVRSFDEIASWSGAFPWKALLEPTGLANRKEFVVRELDAVQQLSENFKAVPVETWRSYLTYHYLASVADVLPKAFDAEAFDFYGRTLNGQIQQRDRWRRSVDAVNRALGEAVGELYVAKHFPQDSKQKMVDLVENLRRAYAKRIRDLTWMSEATKTVALAKLAAFRPKIGYPDRWRDYSALEVRAGDAFGNATRARIFEWQRTLKRIDQSSDRDEWGITPQTVNAYYNSTFNEIVFPAAILQAPYFDPDADPAVNYGAIGGVIGHEMGHGFDDQGSKSDGKGILRSWWQPEDEVAFKARVSRLSTQYAQYEPLPGLKLNGHLTLGENIGDLGGLSVAYEAYKLSLNGKPAPVLNGLTGDQRFFLAWAQVWRSLRREENLRNQVLSDPHSPAEFRINGVVRNMDEWYAAFDVQPGDNLYLDPKDRVRIW